MNVTLTDAVDSCSPVATHAIGHEAASTVAATLKALSDPLRLRMLSAIASDPRGESCVCDLAELAHVSQPTVSHHLKVLKGVDVLTSERRGTWVWYRINPSRRGAVTALLDSFAPATMTAPGEDGDAEGRAGHPEFDARITHLADELAAEVPELAPETVLGIVRESYTSLARTAIVTGALVPLTERFARQRLADLTRDRDSAVPQVLFVCVANAGRSQLAAALVNKLAAGRVVARSAGSAPADVIHPHVRSILAEIEGDLAAERFPKPLTDDAVRAADVVITMGCGDVCPIIPGVRYDDWAVGDPALASREGVEAIRDDIEDRVRALVDELTH
ncbi:MULTISPECIES: metalloregulator ArsR/SmtB family transcription factor [Microbacterium]|jgi:ArsR family transcriptional regulator|uniref:metalloregulator ArsR/SmtB family transcription factor n=1 Tax=Microbacterium TaxID=33882 RepID=UPI0004933625|nr:MULTISPECIES: metalloregulator ArsR/SmtB family transcription factor [Microbacterium]AVL96131.1 ArsR family transcriptional regulator [Microbacterium sp. str. 'China']KYJ98093.1 ArsR family transcriptional regulator [Microbacterium sp. CH1]MCT1394423.1 metalloregulator ArsR/SmtB family transcription factor [Microbacterium sp. p3-SID338]MDH5131992.1 metalloregulator ArsR/SmtB family transcription factor [Microbacterium sp. RD10]MDH5135745.1 metalloregulator ArsR/SmtB family transcription fac